MSIRTCSSTSAAVVVVAGAAAAASNTLFESVLWFPFAGLSGNVTSDENETKRTFGSVPTVPYCRSNSTRSPVCLFLLFLNSCLLLLVDERNDFNGWKFSYF